jgi:hypothetical protein
MKHERRNHLKTLGGCLKDLDHLFIAENNKYLTIFLCAIV